MGAKFSGLDAGQISEMLAANVLSLVQHIFPAGKRADHEWEVGSLRGEPGQSLKVHLVGAKAGIWMDFASGEGGDALELVSKSICRGDKKEAILWAKSFLGLGGSNPERLKEARKQAERREEIDADAVAEREAKRKAACNIFLSQGAGIIGTPVEIYLQGRGIDLSKLPFPLGSLRYHPALWNVEAQRKLPAMLAAITGPDGELCAVHRTYLEVQGKLVTKARLKNPKMTLGFYKGGCIRLWAGVSPDGKKGLPLNQAPAPVEIDITEGIEDGLTVATSLPSSRVLVAVSLGNLGAMLLPEAVTALVIWAQNDKPGSPAEIALRKAVERFQDQGRKVRLARPPAGIKDINDFIRGQAA
jgi:hypothetical protein